MNHEEFLQEFIEEALGHMEEYEAALLDLARGSRDSEIVNKAFRAVHSIKGAAGFFALHNIVKLSHSMENILGQIRENKREITDTVIERCLFGCDTLRNLITDSLTSNDVDISDMIHMLEKLERGEEEPIGPATAAAKEAEPDLTYSSTPFPGVELFIPLDEDEESIAEIPVLEPVKKSDGAPAVKLASIEELMDQFPAHAEQPMDDLPIPVTPAKSAPAAASMIDFEEFAGAIDQFVTKASPKELEAQASKSQQPADESVRVSVSLLNNLLDLAGEMVLVRNQLLKTLESVQKTIPGLQGVLQNIDSITTELQEQIMRTRMQPISRVFNKFPRIMRELTRVTGKDAHLHIDGGDVELDKSLIESLTDPLTHLIRNAIDHGIELPEERAAAGKNRSGSILMRAYHEGDHVTIDIMDDGRGIDSKKIKEKAIAKGLLRTNEATHMSEDDLLNLIFFPGFSTSNEISSISGRGVGMDVVKTNVEKMGGSIEIKTKIGKGTTFRLHLPLTLAIIPSLLVGAGGQKFVLPQVYLQEMLRIKSNDPHRKFEKIKHAWMLRLRGKLLPIIHLADVLGIGYQTMEKQEKVRRVLVLKLGARQFGLVVDSIHQREEILVKPLPRYLRMFKSYFGVTIQGDGKTAMILDPEGIAATANLRFFDSSDVNESVVEEIRADKQNVLICSFGSHEKFGIDLAQVSRVEKIKSSAIEMVGGHEMISYRGDLLQVVRPEALFPLGRTEKLPEHVYLVLPKHIACPTGLLMLTLHDTIVTEVHFASERSHTRGLVGTAMIKNQPIQMIDLLEFMQLTVPERTDTDDVKARVPGKRILLVEDTPFYSKLLISHLSKAGYTVELAVDGMQGLTMWKDPNRPLYDAVIADDSLPRLSGLDLLRETKEHDRNPDAFRMLISLRLNPELIEECIQLGSVHSLYKGNWENIFKMLNNWFSIQGGLSRAR